MIFAKGTRQQFTNRHCQFFPTHGRHCDRGVGAREFRDLLPASAAGRHRFGCIGKNSDLDNVAPATDRHRRDRTGLGTGALGVRDIFNVAAAMNLT
jgi:hypothetical protein